MELFSKKKNNNETHDGQGNDRQGFIDVVRYNGEKEDLLWRFPHDNLSTLTQLVVQEGQEAVFMSGGQCADIFGPGTHTLSTNNIPILQKLVNLPFGGQSPFKATVFFVNTTIKRDLKWGTIGMFPIRDPFFNVTINVGSAGSYGIRITNSAMFIRQYAGTSHSVTTDDLRNDFREAISQRIKPCVSAFFGKNQISVTEVNNHLPEISDCARNSLTPYFDEYGIQLTNFDVAGVNIDEDDRQYQRIKEAQTSSSAMDFESAALARKRTREGYSYQQERQFDVMENAAGNEGGAGQMMGAGMGLGMGVGVGGAFGSQMSQMANVMNPASPQTPPPPPTAPLFHVLVNNQQTGPFDLNTLSQMAQNGALTHSTYVWKAGLPQWVAAGACPELAHLFGSVPPPPPTI